MLTIAYRTFLYKNSFGTLSIITILYIGMQNKNNNK